MFGIKAKITKCIDDTGHPSFVECQFIDANGITQIFHDKDAIFTVQSLDRNSKYPTDAVIACEIIEKKAMDGQNITKVDTEKPWFVESINGETIFEVLGNQMIEFEHL